MAPPSTQASPAEESADALGRALSGLVISVSGRIPGKNHDQIKRMVEKCGAKYEDQDIGDCTHLITTSNSMKTAKVREVRGRKGCEIVSIDWLIASMDELKPMRADDFKVGKPTLIKANFDPEFLGQKRKLDTEFESEHGSSKKPRNKPPAGFEKALAIVDRENTKTTVWIDEKGVRWDAILVKVSQVIKGNPSFNYTRIFHTSTYRIQLLFDVEQKTYFIDVREDQDYYRTDKSSLETAQTEFRRAFREASGLPWGSRNNKPKDDRYMFVVGGNDSTGDGSSSTQKNKTAAPALKLSDEVCSVLEMLLNPAPKDAIQRLITDLSVNRKAVLEQQTMRVGRAILDKISGLPHDSSGKLSGDDLEAAEKLINCYIWLMFYREPSDHRDAAWVQKEREVVCFLDNLIKLRDMRDGPTKLEGKALLRTAHRELCLPKITRVKKDSTEYRLLSEYSTKSRSANRPQWTVRAVQDPAKVLNIFRVEGAGESNRLAQWTEDNNEKAGERRLLWHGSTVRNFVGILSQGLRLGVYRDKTDFGIFFADMAGKWATYCRALPGQAALMLLCEVELGHTMLPWNIERRKIKASDGCAILVEGCKYHNKWQDAKRVHRDLAGIMMPDLCAGTTYSRGTAPWYGHNEYVVHDPAQIRQRYLFQIKFN